jgi:hypothetical protein
MLVSSLTMRVLLRHACRFLLRLLGSVLAAGAGLAVGMAARGVWEALRY